jgi:phosphate transport system substrate-binding protein
MNHLPIIMKSFLPALAILLFSCSGGGKKSATDTPTQGKIHIAVDEAFLPLISSEITAFQGLYTKAKVIPHYVSEKKAFELLLADSVRLVVSGRHFTEEEKAYFKSIPITPRSLKIATDAVGIVLNLSNPDSMLTKEQVARILTEPGFKWKSLSGKGRDKEPEIVLDKEGTSNFYSVLNHLKIKESDLKVKKIYAGGDREVINYVNLHPEAIGFMGVNWISDSEDPTQTRFRNGIRVAYLMPDSIAELMKKDPLLVSEESYYQPLQAYLAQGFYPLTRDVVVASREARTGLGTGFTAWLASDKGQRIVLKAGLLPATMPIRIVKIKKDNDLTN